MIIIKTANGDNFINEKETHLVQHDKANSQVIIRSAKDGLNCIISNVEGIIYTNDAQPVRWQDEGSAMQRMQKSLDERKEVIDKQRTEILAIEQERDELKARLAELEAKPDPSRWWTDDVDVAPVSLLISHVEKQWGSFGYGERFRKLFQQNNINTVGDLLRIGKRDLRKYRNVGGKSITRIDDALENMYNIKEW